MSSTTRKKVTLKLSDGKIDEVDEAVVVVSETIKNKMEDGSADIVVDMRSTTVKVYEKVIEFCKKHVDSEKLSKDDLKAWDTKFMDLNYDLILDLSLAARYLGIKSLSTLTVHSMLDQITPEKIKEAFPDGTRIKILLR